MRSPVNLAAIPVLALLASAGHALAQTGEFANQPPGSVVHQGYALQDWWQQQNARNRGFAGPWLEPAQGPKPRQMDSYETTKRRDKQP
jgi:hypothetical protein